MQVIKMLLLEGPIMILLHLMFLDIDEFWLLQTLTQVFRLHQSGIKGDGVSFDWLLK